MADYEKINQIIRSWGNENKSKLRQKVQSQTSSDRNKLVNSITVRTGTRDGAIYRVSFGLLRHGIMVEKGVGRGWPIARAGSGLKNSVNSTGGRVPKPWFNPIIEPAVKELADELAEEHADLQMNEIRIK